MRWQRIRITQPRMPFMINSNRCLRSDIKILVGDFNVKAGREGIFGPTIGQHNLHVKISYNEFRLASFAAEQNMLISSAPDFSTAMCTSWLGNPLISILGSRLIMLWLTCVKHSWPAHTSGHQHWLRPLPCLNVFTLVRTQQQMQINTAQAWYTESAITKDYWIVLQSSFGTPSRCSTRYRRQCAVTTHCSLLAHCSWGKGWTP